MCVCLRSNKRATPLRLNDVTLDINGLENKDPNTTAEGVALEPELLHQYSASNKRKSDGFNESTILSSQATHTPIFAGE